MTEAARTKPAQFAVAALAPALCGAFAALPCIRFQPDDLFIYLRMARNIVGGAGWGFNPGEAVNVASSPVWLALLASLDRLGLSGPGPAQAASGCFSLLAVAGVAWLASALARDPRAAWAAGLAFAADAWMGRWFWSGMETGLAVAVLSFALAVRARGNAGGGRDAASGALLALLPLVRPELVCFSLAAVAAGLLARGPGASRRALRDLLFLGVVGICWAWFATRTWGAIAPASVVAKGTLGAAGVGFFASFFRTVAAVAATAWPMLVGGAALALTARRGSATPGRGPGVRAAAWTIAAGAALLAVFYAVRNVKVYTRYVLPLTAVFVALAGAAAVVGAQRCATPRLRRLWSLPLALALTWNLGLAGLVVIPSTRAYARSMRTVLSPLAERLRAETTPGDVIATPNIGLIGWITGRPILDLNGLATPAVVAYKRAGRIREYLQEHPPAVLVEIEPRPRQWLANPGDLDLREIAAGAFEGMFVQGPNPMFITAYRVLGVRGREAAP